jgi:hypothetical protein
MSKAIVPTDELFMWPREVDVSLRETGKICLDDSCHQLHWSDRQERLANYCWGQGKLQWILMRGVIRGILVWGHQHYR